MPSATEIIVEVERLISEENLQRVCDVPISSALSTFEYDPTAEVTHKNFLEVTGRYVKHLFEHAWVPWHYLSIDQARAEAIMLLQHDYQGSFASGYDAAYLEACDPALGGVECVLARLNEALIAKARTRYIQWVFHSWIHVLEWPLRRDIARELLVRGRQLMPDSLSLVDPDRMADYCPELIMALVAADMHVLELIAPHRSMARSPAKSSS